MAAPSTLKVYNVLRQQDGTPLVNANVHLILDYNQATVTATGDDIIDLQQSATTDATGTYTFTVVPTDLMSPSNLTYTVVEPNRTYQIAPLSTGGASQQATAAGVIVNQPGALAAATQNVTGPLTVQGALVAQSTLQSQGVARFDADAQFHGPDPWYDVKHPSFGAKGDGVTDDTAAIQAAVNAAILVASGDTAKGAIVYLPPGTYLVSSLTYTGGFWTLRGAGMNSSVLRQKSGSATPLIAPTGSGYPYSAVSFEEFQIEGWFNNASAGGIQLEGSPRSTVRRVGFQGGLVFGIKVLGHGNAASGDAMFCTIEECEFNPQNAAYICVQASYPSGGGSHPDALRVLNCYVNGNSSTVFVQIDQAPVGAGILGADSAVVAFNRVEGCGTFVDINSQASFVLGNRVEVVSGTLNITIRSGPANFPSQGNKFIGNTYATGGVPANLVFTDNGQSTTRYLDGPNAVLADTVLSPPFNSAPSPDAGISGLYAMAALTGNVNVQNMLNAVRGQKIRFIWTQDATGGRAVTYAGTNFRAGGIAAQSTAANTVTIDEAECVDGTVWRVVRLVSGQAI